MGVSRLFNAFYHCGSGHDLGHCNPPDLTGPDKRISGVGNPLKITSFYDGTIISSEHQYLL
jgi:hypothetical protein